MHRALPRSFRRFCCAITLAVVCAIVSPAFAQQVRVTLDPAQTNVTISVHDVHGGFHGAFQMKSGVISFDPATGATNGEVIVDANSGNTGNDTRDRKMKKEVLETQRYPEITFTPNHIAGQVLPQGASHLKVDGVFHIHGADHNLALDVPVQVAGDTLTGTSTFTIPYESWGMKNPSFLFLRVDGTAEVRISFTGRISPSNPTRSESQPTAPSH